MCHSPQTTFKKQVLAPLRCGFLVVAAEAERSSELEERPFTGPDPRFFCPTRPARLPATARSSGAVAAPPQLPTPLMRYGNCRLWPAWTRCKRKARTTTGEGAVRP